MKRVIERNFWKGMAVVIAGALWVIALKLSGGIALDAYASIDQKETVQSYHLNRLEYARLLLNSHPYIRILTPHLMSQYLVTEAGVQHLITYDQKYWDQKKIEGELLNVRHQNAVKAMRNIGFKSFQLSDIQTSFEPY